MSTTERRRVIAGNWKMYKTPTDTRAFFSAFNPLAVGVNDSTSSSLHPPSISPPPWKPPKARKSVFPRRTCIGQKKAPLPASCPLRCVDAGCSYTLIGHSERRQFFGETDETVFKKTRAALTAGLTPIVCIGEMLADREAGNTEHVGQKQFLGRRRVDP